jgi:hypothetical protein
VRRGEERRREGRWRERERKISADVTLSLLVLYSSFEMAKLISPHVTKKVDPITT